MKNLRKFYRPFFMILSAALAIALCAHAQAAQAPEAAKSDEHWITHTVRSGETLQVISQHYYGTTRKWNEIFRTNRELLRTPQQVEPGMRLSLRVAKDSALAAHAQKVHRSPRRSPASIRVEVLDSTHAVTRVVAPAGPSSAPHTEASAQPKVAEVIPPHVAVEAESRAPTHAPEPAAKPAEKPAVALNPPKIRAGFASDSLIEIKVRNGDTLESLAEAHLGSAKFWPRIIELNHKTLHEPDDLKPGMRIWIEELLPRTAEASPAPASDQFSAIDTASGEAPTDSAQESPSPAAIVAPEAAPAPAPPSPKHASSSSGLTRYEDFLDP